MTRLSSAPADETLEATLQFHTDVRAPYRSKSLSNNIIRDMWNQNHPSSRQACTRSSKVLLRVTVGIFAPSATRAQDNSCFSRIDFQRQEDVLLCVALFHPDQKKRLHVDAQIKTMHQSPTKQLLTEIIYHQITLDTSRMIYSGLDT